jgi:hypothetical protein
LVDRIDCFYEFDPAYAQACRPRLTEVSRVAWKKIEALFGEAKPTLSLVRLRLRGLSGAGAEAD